MKYQEEEAGLQRRKRKEILSNVAFTQRQLIKDLSGSTWHWINLSSLLWKNLLVYFHLHSFNLMLLFFSLPCNSLTHCSCSPHPPLCAWIHCSFARFKQIFLPSSCHLKFQTIALCELACKCHTRWTVTYGLAVYVCFCGDVKWIWLLIVQIIFCNRWK